MQKKYLVVTAAMLCTFICYYYLYKNNSPLRQDIVIDGQQARVPSSDTALSEEIHDLNINKPWGEKDQWIKKFREANLPGPKIQAMFDLSEFHQNMPIVNRRNIEKRNELLEVLNENPKETVTSFNQLMKISKPQDDDFRTFLINIAMGLQISDEEKCELIVTRAKQGASFTQNALADDELSLVIGFSHLSAMEESDAKARAIEEIYNSASLTPEYGDLLHDYFPQTRK